MTREQFIIHMEGTSKALRRFLVALCCGNFALADDIAQKTYIKAYLSRDACNNIEKFNVWIFRIGYTTFIDYKRAAKNFVDYEEARDITSDDLSDAVFRYQDLYTALNRLPPKERMSLLLFYMECYSVKEIAAIVETSQDAVKQHLSRGRSHLRILLSNY